MGARSTVFRRLQAARAQRPGPCYCRRYGQGPSVERISDGVLRGRAASTGSCSAGRVPPPQHGADYPRYPTALARRAPAGRSQRRDRASSVASESSTNPRVTRRGWIWPAISPLRATQAGQTWGPSTGPSRSDLIIVSARAASQPGRGPRPRKRCPGPPARPGHPFDTQSDARRSRAIVARVGRMPDVGRPRGRTTARPPARAARTGRRGTRRVLPSL